MRVLEGIEPQRVFHFFEQICTIPHGSRNTRAISDWCVAFAKERGLEHHQDQADNVIIIKEATPGYEHAESIILQGHLDMVCEKEVGCSKDMDREGLDLMVDGDVIRAVGTTLGGDDGIAVAMMLAILDAQDLAHPRLEAVFTADEEIGLLGASAIDVRPLQGRRMVNLDSETEGIFTVSCAGGSTDRCILPLVRAEHAGTALTVTVRGLQGGHSGTEIHKGGANANILMGRILQAMAARTQLRIQWVRGGLKDNAIPVASEALLSVEDAPAARAAVEELAAALQNEYRVTDPGLEVSVAEGGETACPMDAATTDKVICMLTCLPNGVQAMSADIPGLVQTSVNLGILSTEEEGLSASCCVRSSVDSQKEMLKARLTTLMTQLGGRVEVSGDYPGWAYLPESPLRRTMTDVFQERYGYEPKIEAIHAGLECGLFAGKIPGLDCVSIGPDLLEIHTPREAMCIASVQRVWAFLLEVLARAKG